MKIRVSEDAHKRLKEEAKRRGVTMLKLVDELSMQGVEEEPYEEIIGVMRDDGELEGLASAWDRNYATTVSVNQFTSRLFDILMTSVGSRRVKDKKTYLEWLAVKEYRKWCGG